jgi:HAD superfamily hydrolase (TIGR01549 family)
LRETEHVEHLVEIARRLHETRVPILADGTRSEIALVDAFVAGLRTRYATTDGPVRDVDWDLEAEANVDWATGQLEPFLVDKDDGVRAYAALLQDALEHLRAVRAERNTTIRAALGGVRAIAFDVGETLVDETRAWVAWADWLGIPRLTFLAVCGAVIARGGADHREPFRIFRPGLDVADEIKFREIAGMPDTILRSDLYADAIPSLQGLRDAGFRLAVVGNQPASATAALRALDLPVDLLGTSGEWGVQKPDVAFFARLAEELKLSAGEVAYVGDRLDNDVRPAASAGMVAVFLRRGPWGWIQAPGEEPPEAAVTLTSLGELPAALTTRGPSRQTPAMRGGRG